MRVASHVPTRRRADGNVFRAISRRDMESWRGPVKFSRSALPSTGCIVHGSIGSVVVTFEESGASHSPSPARMIRPRGDMRRGGLPGGGCLGFLPLVIVVGGVLFYRAPPPAPGP